MHIAFVHPFLFRTPRGIERYTFNLANTLAASAQVDLITWKWPDPIQIDRLDHRVNVHVLPTSRYYASQAIVPFYMWHMLAHRYDWLWIFFAGYGEAEALSLVRRQRFGIVFHYPYSQAPHRYAEFRRFGLVRRADQLVSVSRCVEKGVDEFFGQPSTIIPHGVDANRFKPCPQVRSEVRSKLGLPVETPLLLTAAALEERKGVQYVLRALPHVLEQFPNVAYLVLGEGDYRGMLERLARELGVADRVRFLGAQSDIVPFYQAADLSIILSRGEASSLTALESLACSVPVVAANRPPFDELLTPDCGILVDETDELQASSTISGLVANTERKQKMGEAGRRRVCANFTWEHVGKQYLEIMRANN